MRIRIFAIGLALVAYMGFTSCDDDQVDAPSDGTEQQDPSDPDNPDNPDTPDTPDNPDEGSDENKGEDPDPGPFVPPTITEPLSAEVRTEMTIGKRWDYKNFLSDGSIKEGSLIVGGETVVECKDIDYTAKVLVSYNNGIPGDVNHGSPVWENNGIVYFLQDCEEAPGIVVAPGYKGGDGFALDHIVNPTEGKIYNGSYHDIKLLSRGTVVFQGVERRAAKVEMLRGREGQTKIDYWVEGIGSLFGLYVDYSYTRPCGLDYLKYSLERRLMKCYDGDKLIYDYSEWREELYNEIEVFEYNE